MKIFLLILLISLTSCQLAELEQLEELLVGADMGQAGLPTIQDESQVVTTESEQPETTKSTLRMSPANRALLEEEFFAETRTARPSRPKMSRAQMIALMQPRGVAQSYGGSQRAAPVASYATTRTAPLPKAAPVASYASPRAAPASSYAATRKSPLPRVLPSTPYAEKPTAAPRTSPTYGARASAVRVAPIPSPAYY